MSSRLQLLALALAFFCARGALAFAPSSSASWRQRGVVLRGRATGPVLPGMRSVRLHMCDAKDAAAAGDAAPVEVGEAVEAVVADDRLMVGPFNVKDYNDWISVFLYGVIAWQTFGIIRDVGKGVLEKFQQH